MRCALRSSNCMVTDVRGFGQSAARYIRRGLPATAKCVRSIGTVTSHHHKDLRELLRNSKSRCIQRGFAQIKLIHNERCVNKEVLGRGNLLQCHECRGANGMVVCKFHPGSAWWRMGNLEAVLSDSPEGGPICTAHACARLRCATRCWTSFPPVDAIFCWRGRVNEGELDGHYWKPLDCTSQTLLTRYQTIFVTCIPWKTPT